MPPRNNPLPAAVRLFNCSICDKGYPRQVDYENHLRSYDHNHRQRLADMKKLTASNEPESNKPKQGQDMRSINVEEANKKMGAGGRFTKIGGGTTSTGRFKKVGVTVGVKGDEKKSDDVDTVAEEDKAVMTEPVPEAKPESKQDTVMADQDEIQEDDAVSWDEYDFAKPTGCDHASCEGCKTDDIWSGKWVEV